MAINVKAGRTLIVEDEMLIALDLEEQLNALGFRVAEIANHLEKAFELARSGSFDLAILDVNLRGSASYPVADMLRQRGIPFLFATGYGAGGVDSAYRNETILSKPVNAHVLEHAIADVLSRQDC